MFQVSGSCPKDCRCPPDTPRCAAGVSLMLDGCGCCHVCPKQLFEDCSKTQPCDHTKGLECNFGGGHASARGICRGTVASVLFPIIFLYKFALFLFRFLYVLFSVFWNQLNQMAEHVSTTIRYTRMGKSFVQTANTSVLAWTALLDVSPSVHMSSRCPNWAVQSQAGSRYPDSAVNSSSALKTQRQTALRWRTKSTGKTECLKMTLPTGRSWRPCGEENPSLYLVSSFTFSWLHLEANTRKKNKKNKSVEWLKLTYMNALNEISSATVALFFL